MLKKTRERERRSSCKLISLLPTIVSVSLILLWLPFMGFSSDFKTFAIAPPSGEPPLYLTGEQLCVACVRLSAHSKKKRKKQREKKKNTSSSSSVQALLGERVPGVSAQPGCITEKWMIGLALAHCSVSTTCCL